MSQDIQFDCPFELPHTNEERLDRLLQLKTWLKEHEKNERGFDMTSWVNSHFCGTTVCMAGLICFQASGLEWDSKRPDLLKTWVNDLHTQIVDEILRSSQPLPEILEEPEFQALAGLWLGLGSDETDALFLTDYWELDRCHPNYEYVKLESKGDIKGIYRLTHEVIDEFIHHKFVDAEGDRHVPSAAGKLRAWNNAAAETTE